MSVTCLCKVSFKSAYPLRKYYTRHVDDRFKQKFRISFRPSRIS